MKSSAQLIPALNALRFSYTEEDTQKLEIALGSLEKLRNVPAASLTTLHDMLLYLKAFPQSENVAALADKSLRLLENFLLKEVNKKNKAVLKAIENTGISGSRIVASFSYELISSLVEVFPDAVRYDSCAVDPDEYFSLLQTLLPFPLKEHFMEGGWSTVDEWLDAICNKDRHRKLNLILTLFREAAIPKAQCDLLFDRLQLYIEADLTRMPSRSNIFLPVSSPYIHHDGVLKKVDVSSVIHSEIEEDHSVTIEERKRIVSAVRWTLFALFRETDPGTYADLHDVRVFNVGRGLQIVLLGMKHEWRNPVDAYIGFMAFKNGCPYAYGGAWMLGPMAKIGINIFPAYRGGESAFFFAQLMRVYQQVFQPEYFVAEPYQVGRDNPEGIETGAFWFYYRLGYRPIKPILKKLAATEFEKLKSGKVKKSSAVVLRKLVADELVWVEREKEKLLKEKFDTAMLSAKLFTVIQKRYKGDLIAFRKDALRSMQPRVFSIDEQLLLAEIMPTLCDYVYASGGLNGWSDKECDDLHQIMLEKTRGVDSEYARLFAMHQRLNRQLSLFARSKK
jgi:hypothetical protein